MRGVDVTDCVSIFSNCCGFGHVIFVSGCFTYQCALTAIYYDDGSRGYFIPRAEAKAVTRSEVYKFVGIRLAFDSHEDRWLWLDIFSLSAYRFQPSTVA